MVAGINLIPSELAAKGPFGKTAAILNSVVVYGFIFFLLLSLGIISFFIFERISLNQSISHQGELKNSIKALQDTEQSLVLIKDRVGKIKDLTAESEQVGRFTTLVGSLGAVTIREAQIDKGKVELSTLQPSSSTLTQFMSILVSLNLYKRVELISFGFNPSLGYLVSLRLSDK